MITMKEYVRCDDCEAIFDADELVMGAANDDHGIDEWFCPICGGADYDIVFDNENESW